VETIQAWVRWLVPTFTTTSPGPKAARISAWGDLVRRQLKRVREQQLEEDNNRRRYPAAGL